MSKTTTKELKTQKASRSEIAKKIKNSNVKFITVTFGTQKEGVKTMNCMYPKNLGDNPAKQLGYITVVKPREGYRNVNPRTIKSAKIDGVLYTV